MYKQKSLFDKRVEIQQKHIIKKEEFVSLDESIFARHKKVDVDVKVDSDAVRFVTNKRGDYVPTTFIIHDDEVPLEESIFARHKKTKVDVKVGVNKIVDEEYVDIRDTVFGNKTIYHDTTKDEDIGFIPIIQDDEVPFEESIFARHKKSKIYKNELSIEDNKIKLDNLFNKYKVLYLNEYIANIKKLHVIDAETYNTCCNNLEMSQSVKFMNTEYYDLIKRIIKTVCMSIESTFYSYTNLNRTFIHLNTEMNQDMDLFLSYSIVDKAYADVINEFGGK
jgi:hypothetical protein